MELAQFKPGHVNIDYHVAFEGHYDSVPHQHMGQVVELRIKGTTLEVLLCRQRIAARARSAKVGGFTTVAEHMPASHRAHPEQFHRARLGLIRLGREFGDDRLEAACASAQSIRAPYYRSVKSNLTRGLGRQDSRRLDGAGSSVSPMPSHDNVRGSGCDH